MEKKIFMAEFRNLILLIINILIRVFLFALGPFIGAVVIFLLRPVYVVYIPLCMIAVLLVSWIESEIIKYYMITRYVRNKDISFEQAQKELSNHHYSSVIMYFIRFIFGP